MTELSYSTRTRRLVIVCVYGCVDYDNLTTVLRTVLYKNGSTYSISATNHLPYSFLSIMVYYKQGIVKLVSQLLYSQKKRNRFQINPQDWHVFIIQLRFIRKNDGLNPVKNNYCVESVIKLKYSTNTLVLYMTEK